MKNWRPIDHVLGLYPFHVVFHVLHAGVVKAVGDTVVVHLLLRDDKTAEVDGDRNAAGLHHHDLVSCRHELFLPLRVLFQSDFFVLAKE